MACLRGGGPGGVGACALPGSGPPPCSTGASTPDARAPAGEIPRSTCRARPGCTRGGLCRAPPRGSASAA
eukprot:5185870-Lingulodinium_polyedra.AAC.1